MIRILRSAAILATCLSALPGGPSSAAGSDDVRKQLEQINSTGRKNSYGFTRGSFLVAPVPFSDPTIGTGLALGLGYLFKDDEKSNTSVLGFGALRSDNGTQAAGLIANLAFNNNRWLVETFFGRAEARYDLFTSGGGKIPIQQDGDLARIKFAYGVTPELSFGTSVRYLNTTIRPDSGQPTLPPRLAPDTSLELLNLGLTADWDFRDDGDYPTEGGRLSIETIYGTTLGGIARSYRKGFLLMDGYKSFGDADVFALRGAICATSDDTPFFDQCSLGSTDSFRGFNSTQFLDHRLTSVQAEWRHRFSDRWGMVAFAGIGWTGAQFNQLSNGGSHSAIGAGARYRVSKKFPVDFSVDVSHNNLSERIVYISVGQRF